MSLPKQLINLLGILVVAAVVAIGAVALALPLYTQALDTDAQTARVAQTNNGYDIQVQALQAAKRSLPQTEQEVAQLRTQITVPNHLDDAFEIAIRAAAATASTITRMTAADPEPFAARTAVGDDGKAVAPTPAPASDATSAAATSAAASQTDAAAAPAPETTAAPDGRTQAPFTITVDVPSPDAAAAFLDQLRRGPRLIAVVHSALTGTAASGDSDASYTLTVDALAFVRTAD